MELEYAPLTILLYILVKGKAKHKDEKNKGEECVMHFVKKMIDVCLL